MARKRSQVGSVLLNSHTDVVPVETQKWIHPPFAAYIDSSANIYARGSQGFVMNLQPSAAEVGLDVRVPPTVNRESLERRIAEEWAPASRNMTFEFKLKIPVLDKFGKPILSAVDSSNPLWFLLEETVSSAGRRLDKPEINTGSTDASYYRRWGLPAKGFSPIANTPSLIHYHNEYLNQAEYLKGVDVYASIIKAYTSYSNKTLTEASEHEL